jgi:N-acetylglucosamine malate deacetylase 1
MTPEPCALLAIGPHPDDVELFCGGTVALAVAQGHRVALLDLTYGELASRGTPEERSAEAAAAAGLLGVAERLCLGLPDGGLGDPDRPSADEGALAALVDALRGLRPAVVLAPWREDRHPDHAAAHALVRRAVFFAGLHRYREATGLERHRVDRVCYYPMRVEARPSFLVDISAVAATKRRAIEAHASQVGQRPGSPATLLGAPDALAALDARDRYWGAQLGVERAEAFVTGAVVPVDDVVAHFRGRPEPHLTPEAP